MCFTDDMIYIIHCLFYLQIYDILCSWGRLVRVLLNEDNVYIGNKDCIAHDTAQPAIGLDWTDRPNVNPSKTAATVLCEWPTSSTIAEVKPDANVQHTLGRIQYIAEILPYAQKWLSSPSWSYSLLWWPVYSND